MEALRAEVAAHPVSQPIGTDEFTHLRSHVAQLEGDLRATSKLQRRFQRNKSSFCCKRWLQVWPTSGSVATEMALVPVAMSGSALMSHLIDEVDKKSPREWWWAIKWCKSVGARCGCKRLRLGEARNPGPPKRVGFLPTSWSGICTRRLQIPEMRDGWRSSLMGCHCSEAHS